MDKVLLLLLVVAVLEASYFQNEYVIKFERAELEWIDNKILVQPTSIVTYKYNRSTAVFNTTLTFATDIDGSMMVLSEAFKFASNEYREFPMRFQFNYCKAIHDNDFGIANTLKCGNYSGCPIKKGRYFTCNSKLEQTRFPPLIPFGRYKIKLTSIYKSKPIQISNIFFAIEYPVKWQ